MTKLTHSEEIKFIKDCKLPEDIIVPPVTWKYLLRSVIRGNNVMMVGHSGCGKTMTAQAIREAFPDRPFESFNIGATQDARSFLIGNTHYNSKDGTFFNESLFVKMIKTPNAIILLDELTRGSPDAWNILMSVLDKKQRYLRIDEHPDTPTVRVADGVSFISTANIGGEYTSTRVLDRALKERFIMIEMKLLTKDEEIKLLTKMYPDVDKTNIENIAEIATHTRDEVVSENPHISTIVSTRMTLEMAGLIHDGFTLAEAVEVSVYPFYSSAGGITSEQSYMRKFVQKLLPTELDSTNDPFGQDTSDDDDDDDDDKTNKVPWKQNGP